MARQQRSTTFTQESTRNITKVALYARVSTLNNQDPEMQLRELRQYATARGWDVVNEYVDCGISGSVESRPAEDSYGTAGSFKTGGKTRFHGDPSGKEIEV